MRQWRPCKLQRRLQDLLQKKNARCEKGKAADRRKRMAEEAKAKRRAKWLADVEGTECENRMKREKRKALRGSKELRKSKDLQEMSP